MSPEVICSAKGCTQAATWLIVWRNPRIHDESRRKQWVACVDHRDHLSQFLRARSFPVSVEPLAAT